MEYPEKKVEGSVRIQREMTKDGLVIIADIITNGVHHYTPILISFEELKKYASSQ